MSTSLKVATRVRWLPWAVVPVLGLVAVLALACFLLTGPARFRQRFPVASGRLRHTGLVLGVVFLVSLAMVVLYAHLFEPLKFQYLIRRVESARTPQEERAALALAARWGHVWELNRLTERSELPARARPLRGDWVLELEWLESSPWTGQPFRAYRVLLDEENLKVAHPN